MHYCVIKCKLPEHYTILMGKRALKDIVDPTLDEFGYVMPEPDIQQKMDAIEHKRTYQIEHYNSQKTRRSARMKRSVS